MSNVIAWMAANWNAVINIILGLLGVAIAIATLIPGDEPEKTLSKLVELLSKFSKK